VVNPATRAVPCRLVLPHLLRARHAADASASAASPAPPHCSSLSSHPSSSERGHQHPNLILASHCLVSHSVSSFLPPLAKERAEPSSPAKSAISSLPKINRQRRDLLQANSFVLDLSSSPAMAYMAGD
ncbi:unnamed protein product, partial [Urochloa humidicola]